MSTKSRQDQLLRSLRRGGSSTVAQLSRDLGVSRRTVLRDIAALRDQGFALRSSAGPGGGVTLDPASVMVTAKLSGAEAFSLLISVAILQASQAMPFGQLAEAALHKIEQSLPRERALELRRILSAVYIGKPSVEMPPLGEGALDASVLPAFETGFLQARRLRFDYTDRHGTPSERSADPHALLVLSPYWYLVGYDPVREDFRHFRMDRMAGAQVLDEGFRRRAFQVEAGRCPFASMRWR